MNLKAELKAILWLSLPIIANGLLESSMGFSNTFLVAHLSEAELAASALVTMLFFTLMVIFWGIISGVSISISHYHGAENKPAIIGIMRDSLILSLILSIPIMLILWFAPYFFELTGQSAFVVAESKKYLHSLTWAVPFDLPGFVLMQLFTGISRPRINLLFTLGYIPLLIFINYCFMFGKFGLPSLRLAGIGIGTTLAYALFLLALGIFIYSRSHYKKYLDFKNAPSQTFYREIIKIGLPLGFMYSIEIAYFLVLAMFMGKFGNNTLAAHQIVIQFFWLAMNVVFSVGQALSIRLGWRLGREEPQWIMPIVKIGQGIMLIYSLIMAILYWFFPRYLIAIDLSFHPMKESTLIPLAISLFCFAALFQIVETIRLTFFCILRAMKDTRFTLIASVIQFWIVSLPLSYSFAFIWLKKPEGLWIGLIVGALAGCGLLWWRLNIVGERHTFPLQKTITN